MRPTSHQGPGSPQLSQPGHPGVELRGWDSGPRLLPTLSHCIHHARPVSWELLQGSLSLGTGHKHVDPGSALQKRRPWPTQFLEGSAWSNTSPALLSAFGPVVPTWEPGSPHCSSTRMLIPAASHPCPLTCDTRVCRLLLRQAAPSLGAQGWHAEGFLGLGVAQ